MWETWKWTIYALIFYVGVKTLKKIIDKRKTKKYGRNNDNNRTGGNDDNGDGNTTTN